MKSVFESIHVLPQVELDKLDDLISFRKLKKGDFFYQKGRFTLLFFQSSK
jgi:hypothetical protein